MIRVTSLSGKEILVNPDLIRMVEFAPDTILCFSDGNRMPVKETADEILKRVKDFRIEINEGPKKKD